MIQIIILLINLVNYYLMTATNKRLLISESHDDSNRCTPCREKPDQHDTYASTPVHVRPAYASYGRSPYVATFYESPIGLGGYYCSWEKSSPDSTSQPSWVFRGTHLSFSPKIVIEAVRLSQASVNNMLLGLLRPYHRHAIGTFNTCSRIPTPRSLTNTGGGYHIENLEMTTTLSPPFPSEGSTDPSNGPARSQIIHNNYQLNWRGKQILNLASGSLHLTSTITYHIRIAWANDVPSR
jgi:hypothetical protein